VAGLHTETWGGQDGSQGGTFSYAGGYYTRASGSYQHAIGQFNKHYNATSLFVVGNGTADAGESRSDVFRINPGNPAGANNGIVEVTGSLRIDAQGSLIVGLTQSPQSMVHIKQTTDSAYNSTTITNNDSALRFENAAGNGVWIQSVGSNRNLWFGYTTNPAATTSTAQGYLANNMNNFTLMNFTGQHRCLPKSDYSVQDFSDKIGLIVIATGQHSNPLTDVKITIDDSTPVVELSTQRNDKRSFGVISNLEDVTDGKIEFAVGKFVSVADTIQKDNRLFINSVGEGAIWICNINGNFQNGDYITTCEIPGYGMKQDDDLFRNYTVAKITMDCGFDLNNGYYICEAFEYEGKIYRRAFVGCTYHCG
jgi:hypothetical protein